MRKLLLLLLLLVSHVSFGQWNWPVQVNAFMKPYANNYLSYFSDQNNHLQILVTLTDQNASSVPAKLRIRMEGNGWWIETKPEPNSIPALSLEPFVSNIITGLDLQPYFFESNLVKSSASLDLNNLPEGQVELCLEVYGVGGTLTTIGGNQCTYFNIERLQPPQFFPMACGATLDTNLMFHTFQWTPTTGFTPLIGADIEYTYSLYEVVDPNNYAIQVSNQIGLIEQIVTPFQTIQINLFDLNLQVGKKYIWQIRAVVYDNGIPRQMVDNDGFSGICEFYFGEPQSLEETLVDGLEIVLDAQANTQYKGTASWTVTDNTPGSGLSTYERYFIEYRLQPDNTHPNPSWHYDTVIALNKLIYQLAPETTYEVRVSGIAGSFTSDPTPIVAFTTPTAVDYACGNTQIPFRPNNYTPNENIQVGDQVQIGQFMMNITEATPQYEAGRYSGQGWIPVEFLGGARANVVFENVLIDNEYVVRDGRVDVTTDGVDAWLHEQLQDFVDPIYVNGTVDSAWVDTTAGVAWVVIDGVQYDFVFDPPDYPIVIHDDSGMAWTIYPNGTITVEGYLNPSNDHLDVSTDSVAVFAQSATERFGFDAKQHMEWHENYKIIQLTDSSYYFVPNKSIGKNAVDTVDINLAYATTPTFKLDDETTLSFSQQSVNTYSVYIPAISSTGGHEIYAYDDNAQRLGKLNVQVYKQKDRELIVVPIANTTVNASQLKAVLDQTLGEANLNVSVTVAPQWNDTTFTTSKTIALPEDLSVMTDYSQDMRDLRNAYFADTSNEKNSNAYYLFVIPEFDDPNTDGYMVKGKALGFIKGNNYQTYAHELAHGMGGLGHTWKFNGPAQGSTDNLMDYASTGSATASGNNVNLTKAQWKELRDFDLAPTMFDEVEDYLAIVHSLSYQIDTIPVALPANPYDVIVPVSNYDQSDVFRAPNGVFFRLSDNVRSQIDHIIFDNGKVTYLIAGSDTSVFVGEGYYTSGSGANEYVTSTANIVAYLLPSNGRPKRLVSNEGTPVELCSGPISGDYYDFEFPECKDYDGQFVVGWSDQPIYSQVECPSEGECESWDKQTFADVEKNEVKDAFRKIIGWAIQSPGNYNPILHTSGSYSTVDSEERKVIEEKINVLNDLRNDVVVGYIGMPGVLKNLMTQQACDSMAQVVVEELSLEYPNKKLVLFFVNYITGIEEGLFTTTGWSCKTASFATNAPDLIMPGTLPQDLSSLSSTANSFLYLFRKIKKPFYHTTIFQKYDGSLVYRVEKELDDPTKDKYDLPYVFGAKFLVSNLKSAFDLFQSECESIAESMTSYPSGGSSGHTPSHSELMANDNYYMNYSLLLDVRANGENESLEDLSQWHESGTTGEEGEVRIDFEHIKESCLNAKVAVKEVKKKTEGFEYFIDFSLAAGANYGGYSSAVYYDFDVVGKVVDPLVYGGLDLLGMVPGVDFLTDAVGVMYASVRGDAESIVIYSASLALPFVGASYLNRGKKVFHYYAKETSSGGVSYAVKSSDDVIGTGWYKISNEIPYKESKKAQVKSHLLSQKGQFDNEIVRKIIRAKKVYEASSISISDFTHLASNVPTSLSPSTKQALDGFVTDQTFIPFDNLPHVMQSPSTFVNETGSNMYDMVIGGSLYMKYDASDGRILLCDANNGTYYAFVQEATQWTPPTNNNLNQAVQEHMSFQAEKLKVLAGLNGVINFSIQGNNYISSSIKVTTTLGRMSDINNLKSVFGDFKNKDLGEVIGGFNLLNRPNNMFSSGYKDWWLNHNLPWINRSLQRGDNFYLVSPVETAEDINTLLRTLHNGKPVPTITSRELRELHKKGIKPLNISQAKWDEITNIIDIMDSNKLFKFDKL